MPDEMIETIEETVEDATEETVLEESIHDSMVITIPIDDTLSVSGAAADALAVGNALGGKADLTTIKNTLSVNGRTGNGGLSITVNGDNIPAQNDSDNESVAEALTRIEGAASSAVSTEATARENADTALGGRIDGEATARGDADTALDGRLDVLEAKKIVLVSVAFTEAGTETMTVTGITADHELIGHQFFDSSSDPTGEVLADVAWTTGAGSLEVVFSNVQAAGSVRLIFGVPEDITPEEVSS